MSEDKTKQKAFTNWVSEGLKKGYIQAIDKHFRMQYGIKEECDDKQWDQIKEHFSEDD